MRGVTVLIAIVLLASFIGVVQWTDDSDAEYALVYFDYLPRGEYYCPTAIGSPILPENIDFIVAMGSWHLENGDPWDPEAVVTGDMTVTIDIRPDPIPIPDVPTPPSDETVIINPSPTPSSSEKNNGTDLTIYAPFAILIGGLIVALAWALHSRK